MNWKQIFEFNNFRSSTKIFFSITSNKSVKSRPNFKLPQIWNSFQSKLKFSCEHSQAHLPRNFIFSFNVSTRPVGRSDNPEGQVVIEGLTKGHKQGGRMLVFVICGFIKNFLPDFYFILQIYPSLNLKVSVRYS